MPWKIFGNLRNGLEPLEQYSQQKEIFNHLKNLIKIRKENEAISCGYLFTLWSDHFIYAYMREFRGNTIIVVINNGLEDMPQPLPIPIEMNSNIPRRIKKNLADRKRLVNLLDPSDTVWYEDGRIGVLVKGKSAKIYSLVK